MVIMYKSTHKVFSLHEKLELIEYSDQDTSFSDTDSKLPYSAVSIVLNELYYLNELFANGNIYFCLFKVIILFNYLYLSYMCK